MESLFTELRENSVGEIKESFFEEEKYFTSPEDEQKIRKAVFLRSPSWKTLDKPTKMQKISEYMKSHKISGNVKKYAFSKIEYSLETEKITSLKYRALQN